MTRERPAEYVVEEVHEALAGDERLAELELQVSVTAGKVVVTGTVPTDARRDVVASVVREAAPGHEVVNETEVVSADAHPREEEVS